MDEQTKNLILATGLSFLVLLTWMFFFPPEPIPETYERVNEQSGQVSNTGNQKLSDQEVQNYNENAEQDSSDQFAPRVEILTKNLKGSIWLKGGRIDELSLVNYRDTLDKTSNNVSLLSPLGSDKPYYAFHGWAAMEGLENGDTPNSSTVWVLKSGTILTENSPIVLTWKNDLGVIFEKRISVDENYMFEVNQSVINGSDSAVKLYPYGNLTRNGQPDTIGFYILHEGLLATLDDELIEEDYDDIQEEKFTRTSQKGWLGISDKFWLTSLIPPKGKEFKTTFDYKDKWRVNFVATEPLELRGNSIIEDKMDVIIAAKRVDVIDGYAESLQIDKFDLAIDWGMLYFVTRPLFTAIDYFFKLLGNYGLAIIAVTVCIRLAFFPLANFTFRSMAKMKALQPEQARLKELHKDDKMALQKATMALFKREKVNPMSGCLPILVQIPVFFALYKVLFVTIEMRHMPFYGWIQDLGARDPSSIFNLFGLLPFDVPSMLMIGAWPVMMGVSMFIQQKLNPAPTDPMHARIFMFFPLFLTVILAPFPAGLVIYWTFNNIFTMMQQVFIMKRTTVKTVT